MSSDIDFSGAFKRALKGDIDPINLFGMNPTKTELAANAAEIERRGSQIEFEKGDELLKAAGGSVDPATVQIARLRSKTQFKALSPLAPPGGLARLAGVVTEAGLKKKKSSSDARSLAASNAEHARTALLAGNVAKINSTSTGRLSSGRLSRSILGAVRG